MKKVLQLAKLFLLFFVIQQLVSCKKETETSFNPKQETFEKLTTKTDPILPDGLGRQVIGTGFDPTFRLEVTIWGEYVDGKYPHAEISVDPSYVMIGGGARVSNFNNTSVGVNALLTSAYPKNDGTFSTFVADSKEHLILHNHRLWVYVIGMRLYDITATPIPENVIESQMNITSAISPFTGHPTSTSTMPSGNIVLSGGAKINWQFPGTLLTKSFPNNFNGWVASGKDHLQASSATIESFILSINPNIPQFGVLESSGWGTSTLTSNGIQGNINLSTTSIPGGNWLLSGIGGESTYNGVGRMLFGLYPTSATTAVVNDKDHSQVDNGRLYGIVYGIRKQ